MTDHTILQESKMPLLHRTEIMVHLSYTGKPTPSKAELTKSMAERFKVDEKLIAVKYLQPRFGTGSGEALVYVYQNAEAFTRIETIKKKPKKAKEAAAPAKAP